MIEFLKTVKNYVMVAYYLHEKCNKVNSNTDQYYDRCLKISSEFTPNREIFQCIGNTICIFTVLLNSISLKIKNVKYLQFRLLKYVETSQEDSFQYSMNLAIIHKIICTVRWAERL